MHAAPSGWWDNDSLQESGAWWSVTILPVIVGVRTRPREVWQERLEPVGLVVCPAGVWTSGLWVGKGWSHSRGGLCSPEHQNASVSWACVCVSTFEAEFLLPDWAEPAEPGPIPGRLLDSPRLQPFPLRRVPHPHGAGQLAPARGSPCQHPYVTAFGAGAHGTVPWRGGGCQEESGPSGGSKNSSSLPTVSHPARIPWKGPSLLHFLSRARKNRKSSPELPPAPPVSPPAAHLLLGTGFTGGPYPPTRADRALSGMLGAPVPS